MIKAAPATAFIVAQTGVLFQLPVVALDAPALVPPQSTTLVGLEIGSTKLTALAVNAQMNRSGNGSSFVLRAAAKTTGVNTGAVASLERKRRDHHVRAVDRQEKLPRQSVHMVHGGGGNPVERVHRAHLLRQQACLWLRKKISGSCRHKPERAFEKLACLTTGPSPSWARSRAFLVGASSGFMDA